MKRILLLPLILSLIALDANAAARAGARGNSRSSGATGATTGTKPVSARAATTAPSGKVGAAPASGAAKTVNRGRAATNTSTGAKPVVSARAATTQKVISTGTKVATATKNITVDETCQQKYDGCMDSFCMIDNESGGRCTCSDKNAEFDAILAEIEKLDQQSYQMATFGVEKIEMGAFANDAIAAANAAADEILKKDQATKNEENKKKARRTVDLSAWNTPIGMDDEESDVFGSTSSSPIDGKEGDALHRVAADLCAERIPECKADLSLLQMMYSQRIKSDCSAYENVLKQQKTASAQKLQTAERALREAALEQLQNANKYDLGQCTVEFKKCMQTTGGCGSDFSNCAVMSALDNTSTRKSTSNVKTYKIKGAATTIEISAQTYDAVMSKKPLCETVTKSCVAVADQVWDTFLREIAPQLKSAELIAEDKARQDCIGNIANCFQNACNENMDPNDKDGSYDMCLSRPGTMLHVCKIHLNNCGINADSEAAAEASPVWQYIVARLASMRVDSCTTEVKECLTSEDRCGSDYTKCVGLDTDTIIRMCPYEKLTGCQKVYGEDNIQGEETYDKIANMIQGIFLGIDDSFLTTCQNAVNEAVIKVCGSTEDCSAMIIDENMGSRTLGQEICATKDEEEQCFADINMISNELLGYGKDNQPAEFENKITGKLPWDKIDFASGAIELDENGQKQIDAPSDDFNNLVYKTTNEKDILDDTAKREIGTVDRLISTSIAALESDPTIKNCIRGREVQGMRTAGSETSNNLSGSGRFPEITLSGRSLIANAILAAVRDNYNKKLDELNTAGIQNLAILASKVASFDADETEQTEIERIETKRQDYRKICLDSLVKPDETDLLVATLTKPADGLKATLTIDSKQKSNVYQTEETATYNVSENTCTITKKRRDCENIWKNGNDNKRRCKDRKWGDWVSEDPQVIDFDVLADS